ncbi:hypothetical protein N9L68_00430 [bacterium]|nr:hypothetical protein [bacterium]
MFAPHSREQLRCRSCLLDFNQHKKLICKPQVLFLVSLKMQSSGRRLALGIWDHHLRRCREQYPTRPPLGDFLVTWIAF